MFSQISFEDKFVTSFIGISEYERLTPYVEQAHHWLHQKEGAGRDALGWLYAPCDDDITELRAIERAAARVRAQAEAFVVIGIGGSYTGTRAALNFLQPHFYNQLARTRKGAPEIYFVGHHLNTAYLEQLIEVLQGKEVSINVISKSGTTMEPALAFRFMRQWMEKKYGKEKARERIYITTDGNRGPLRRLAEEEGYDSFTIPADIGGRYSVLTPVGLFPMAVSGISIRDVLAGARTAYHAYQHPRLAENECYRYAGIRHLLYQKGKSVEVLAYYNPSFQMFAEWWKQLFGESGGKDNKGILPVTAQYTTDLHSIGQYIQEGLRTLFETVLYVNKAESSLCVAAEKENRDQLNYLTGSTLEDVNEQAFKGTVLAHTDGGVPNLIIRMPKLNAEIFGQLVYFFQKACALNGYLMGVNPFDQGGVEAYKKNMFALLGRPGYNHTKQQLLQRF
ncbi:glucose-6-phosphate isomerase [Mechercharimyces sp. CAU 1602]|uniref:glucose-6-phosphate isomerase n=1 Tax=Mechercharimyces sp. CAU 1602 TaxID=2973933 RepID=UPI0021627AE9|nr:glucose-6-phosphate isomerase [Mechercharimyces sp. CAU 1602]MCS1350668.1 glucose-6-phosphate isomerase [Mechercharimyces sp. CAU 1602]